MHTYDFDTPCNRRNTASLKWDVADGELPLWVADMDFATAPEVQAALRMRVDHGVFGYTVVPEGWREAYRAWWCDRHGTNIQRDWLVFCSGVVPALSSIVRSMTRPGDKVVVQTPVYNIFFNSIENNGRFVAENPLRYCNGTYEMNFEDLEDKLADSRTSMLILCNPHNPVGRVWSRKDLARVGALAWKYDVLVVSDEVHCDLTVPGVEYVPYLSVSPACELGGIALVAPTKAFNLAGLQTASVVAPNETLRRQVKRGLNTDEVAEPNALACLATEAAFREGAPWLDELREYLYINRQTAAAYLAHELPAVNLVESQATYLLWIDCRPICDDARILAAFVRARTGLVLCAGEEYSEMGRGFLRMNAACPRNTLKDALARLKEGLETYRPTATSESQII